MLKVCKLKLLIPKFQEIWVLLPAASSLWSNTGLWPYSTSLSVSQTSRARLRFNCMRWLYFCCFRFCFRVYCNKSRNKTSYKRTVLMNEHAFRVQQLLYKTYNLLSIILDIYFDRSLHHEDSFAAKVHMYVHSTQVRLNSLNSVVVYWSVRFWVQWKQCESSLKKRLS